MFKLLYIGGLLFLLYKVIFPSFKSEKDSKLGKTGGLTIKNSRQEEEQKGEYIDYEELD